MAAHDCPNNKAAVVNGQYTSGCSKCLNGKQKTSLYGRKWSRDRMRENYRKDMLQRYEGEGLNPAWVKEYESQAREEYGDKVIEEVLRK